LGLAFGEAGDEKPSATEYDTTRPRATGSDDLKLTVRQMLRGSYLRQPAGDRQQGRFHAKPRVARVRLCGETGAARPARKSEASSWMPLLWLRLDPMILLWSAPTVRPDLGACCRMENTRSTGRCWWRGSVGANSDGSYSMGYRRRSSSSALLVAAVFGSTAAL
jgi:hypothetical protein